MRLYQESSGPPNYDEYGNIDDDNNYPLVSVIFCKYFCGLYIHVLFIIINDELCILSFVPTAVSSIMSSTSNRINVVSNMVTSFSTATTSKLHK